MLVFYDLDDCIVESSPLIQSAVEEKTRFKNDILTLLEFKVALTKKAFDECFKEIKRAYRWGEKPNISQYIKLGSNDVQKGKNNDNLVLSKEEEKKRRFKRWYWDPYMLTGTAYNNAYREKEMFLEERDHCLEEDNQKEHNYIVDYQNTYVLKNATPGSIEMINEMIESDEYEGYYCLSHHNGGREEKCKRNFINQVFNGKLEFLGMRFHSEEYQEGKRRKRSSKALYIMRKFGLKDLSNCILIDDSTANLDEWIKYGGVAILYRPMSDDEKYTGMLEPHGDKYPRITKMSKVAVDEALKFYKKGYSLKK